MNLRDIRLAKKLGDKFFDSLDSLSKEQEKFTDFKRSIATQIEETLQLEDSEKGLSQYNSGVISFWYYTFRFKYTFYSCSFICNTIATEKLDRLRANQISSKLLSDDSLEDVRTLFDSILHYEILAGHYFASHLDSLGKTGLDDLSNYMKAKDVEEISTHILKGYLATEVVASINANIVLHYLRLVEHSYKMFSKEAGLKIPDEVLLKYNLILTQSFVKRGLEKSETCGQEIKNFIVESFRPE